MKGWLITNAFLQSHKFSEICNWLVKAGRKKGLELIEKTNAEILAVLDDGFKENRNLLGQNILEQDIQEQNINGQDILGQNKPDFILFWDKDIRLARYLEYLGLPVFNSSKAIEICDDKSLTHLQLQSAGIRMPKTLIAPMTYSNIGYTNLDFLKIVMDKLSFPMVIKECFGSFGQQVYLVNTNEELKSKVKEIGAKPILFQEFIKSSSGRDIRLQVVGDKVVASMYRYSANGDFRANITNGGKMLTYEPTSEQKILAINCCKQIGLDFGGVDILFAEEDSPIVCEVNSNAHFKNIYDCTGINVADYIIQYILDTLHKG